MTATSDRFTERRTEPDYSDLRERVMRLEGWLIAALFQGFVTLCGGAAFASWYVITHH